MTVVAYAYSEDLSSVVGTTWTDKVSASGVVPPGHYKIFVSCEYAGTLTNVLSSIRVLLDGVEVASESHIPQTANIPRAFCTMGLAELSEGEHSVVLQYRSEGASQTTHIRRARILVEKH